MSYSQVVIVTRGTRRYLPVTEQVGELIEICRKKIYPAALCTLVTVGGLAGC